jgi:hypothetical protein
MLRRYRILGVRCKLLTLVRPLFSFRETSMIRRWLGLSVLLLACLGTGGSMLDPDGRAQQLQFANGSVIDPDGRTHLAEGSMLDPNGSVSQGGSGIDPNGIA